MISLLPIFLLLAAPAPSSLDQVKADPNPEHRARAAVDYTMLAERNAEAAYAKGDSAAVVEELKNVQAGIEASQDAFTASGKTPGRNPGPYKYAEMHSREVLTRLGDLEKKMDADERAVIAAVRAKVQEIHDAWLEGIMGRKK